MDSSHISKVFAARIGMKANDFRKTYQNVYEMCNIKMTPGRLRHRSLHIPQLRRGPDAPEHGGPFSHLNQGPKHHPAVPGGEKLPDFLNFRPRQPGL